MLAVFSVESVGVGGQKGLLSKLSRVQCCLQYESVRNYPKKPRWLPIAKSKMFKMMRSPVPILPKMETEELKVIWQNYDLYSKSLWTYQAIVNQEMVLQKEKEAYQVTEEAELENMIKFNEEENEKVRKIREAALIEEHKQVEKEILEMRKKEEENELLLLEATEKDVQLKLERLKTAIKLEDLDDVIEKALSVETDYNFGVTKDKKYVIGRLNASEAEELADNPVVPINRPLEEATTTK